MLSSALGMAVAGCGAARTVRGHEYIARPQLQDGGDRHLARQQRIGTEEDHVRGHKDASLGLRVKQAPRPAERLKPACECVAEVTILWLEDRRLAERMTCNLHEYTPAACVTSRRALTASAGACHMRGPIEAAASLHVQPEHNARTGMM